MVLKPCESSYEVRFFERFVASGLTPLLRRCSIEGVAIGSDHQKVVTVRNWPKERKRSEKSNCRAVRTRVIRRKQQIIFITNFT